MSKIEQREGFGSPYAGTITAQPSAFIGDENAITRSRLPHGAAPRSDAISSKTPPLKNALPSKRNASVRKPNRFRQVSSASAHSGKLGKPKPAHISASG
jgi:hypothetical protein